MSDYYVIRRVGGREIRAAGPFDNRNMAQEAKKMQEQNSKYSSTDFDIKQE